MRLYRGIALVAFASVAHGQEVFHVSVTGDGDRTGSSAANAMTMAECNLAMATSDAQAGIQDSFCWIADGVYTTNIDPADGGELSGGSCNTWVGYIMKHGTAATFQTEGNETARGVVVAADNWTPSDADCVFIEGEDHSGNRLAVLRKSNNVSHWIFTEFRSIGPWYDSTMTMSHSNNHINTDHVLYHNSIIWGSALAATGTESQDVMRMHGDETNNIRITESTFHWSQHTKIEVQASSQDYNATLTDRDTAHYLMFDNLSFIGQDHNLTFCCGAWAAWMDHITIQGLSTGSCEFTNSTNYYDDRTVGASGMVDDASDALRIWGWPPSGGGGVSFLTTYDTGNSLSGDRATAIRMLSRNTGTVWKIEGPLQIAHWTSDSNYSADFGLTTVGTEVATAPRILNSIATGTNIDGDCGPEPSQYGEAALWMREDGGAFTTDSVGGIEGSVLGTTSTQLATYLNGSAYNLADSKLDANVPKIKFDVEASNIAVDPDFVDAANGDFTPQNAAVFDIGSPVALMTDADTASASGTMDIPDLFWPPGGPDGGWYDIDSARVLGTIPTSVNDIVDPMPGREFWIGEGPSCGPLRIATVDQSTGDFTWTGGNCTWMIGDGVFLVDPDDGVYAGAWAPGTEPAPPDWVVTPEESLLNKSDVALSILASIDTDGTIYCGIYDDGSTPSAAEVKALGGTGFVNGSSVAVSDSVSNVFSIGGASPATTYDGWCIGEDETPTLMASPSEVADMTTFSDPPPSVGGGRGHVRGFTTR